MLQEIKKLIFSPDSSNIKLGFVLAKYQLSEIEFMKLINSIARDSASENFSCHFYTYMKYEDWENLYEQVPEVHLLGPKVYNKVIPQEVIDLFFKYYNQGPDYILISKRIEYAIMDNLQYYGDDVKLYRSNFLKKRFIYHDFNDVYLIIDLNQELRNSINYHNDWGRIFQLYNLHISQLKSGHGLLNARTFHDWFIMEKITNWIIDNNITDETILLNYLVRLPYSPYYHKPDLSKSYVVDYFKYSSYPRKSLNQLKAICEKYKIKQRQIKKVKLTKWDKNRLEEQYLRNQT